MQQIITNAGAAAVLTPLQLFNQWWDDENPLPGGGARFVVPHCDDHVGAAGTHFAGDDLLNGFPIDCPRPEGVQATTNPFVPAPALPPAPATKDAYYPIALVNRFDLAPNDGANCGEYRIIFAKGSGFTDNRNRNLIIFEAVMPNSRVNQGLVGCKPIEAMWDGLSSLPLNAQIAALQNFYFTGLNPNDGLPAFEPVINPNHYGAQLGGKGGGGYGVNQGCSFGQIRTDQFMNDDSENDPNPKGLGWTLREFKLVQDCRCTQPGQGGQACQLVVVPMTVKTNPYGDLFNSASALVNPGGNYQNFEPVGGDFTKQVTAAALADNHALMLPGNTAVPIPNANESFSYSNPEKYNAAESQSQVPPGAAVNDYVATLDPGFTGILNGQLTAIGSNLNANHIAGRARALSCAGCHQIAGADPEHFGLGGGLIAWPASLGFVHVSEANNGVNYTTSAALNNLFLVNRMTILENYLAAPATNGAAHQTCPLPFNANLQVTCPIPTDKERFPPADLRTLEPTAPPPLNGITLQ